VRNPVLFLDK